MKATLTLFVALLLVCTSAVLAKTPDGTTPSGETICDSESGAAFGLCNAYCEAMDCESPERQASETACARVRGNFMKITGRPLPCETCGAPPPGTVCPCADQLAGFIEVLNGNNLGCTEQGTTISILTDIGVLSATCSAQPPLGGGCTTQPNGGGVGSLSLTPEEGAACVRLVRQRCSPE